MDQPKCSKYKCQVPSCQNSFFRRRVNTKSFFSFPKDDILRRKWFDLINENCSQPVEFCKSPHIKICQDHFKLEFFTSTLKNRFIRGARVFPTIFKQSSKGNVCQSEPLAVNIDSNEKVTLDEDDTSDDEDSVEILNLPFSEEIDSIKSPKKDITSSASESNNSVTENKVYSKSCNTDICRLCLKQATDCKDIFQERIENDTPIFLAITYCMQPLEIFKGDKLPEKICKNCFIAVKNYFGFRQICLENDKIQRELLKGNVGSFPVKRNEPQYSSNSKKRKVSESEHDTERNEENETLIVVTKRVTPNESSFNSENALNDYEEDLSDTEENEFICAMSDVGIFESTSCMYIEGFEFCIIDGYVFEYRLCKEKVRYLRCVLPTCPAKGVQNKIQDGLYSRTVSVIEPHNHARPKDNKRNKQMLFFVIKRKLHRNKALNIRDVYEEICAHDPEKQILAPLKSVINEICKHQLTYKLPVIQSFSEFYDMIEDDNLEKLQFTQNGKQFYQERFTSAQNVQAIVFGNKDIIDQLSDTQLMYVDASFSIDTNEDFDYHLITVLVWIENSYYPIYYGLVSMKCKEIYKQVLQYLHDTLAPNLRPKEIITDFESTLNYALGEVYVNSKIGGSLFYFIQNLYKKICSLNLSRDLETNANFKNMYQMLLMLPLLPVNTILAGLNNIETQARNLGLSSLMRPIFDHVRNEWIINVTPNFFCVHKKDNRIHENVTTPFKKLRDSLMLAKQNASNKPFTIAIVVEKVIELEYYLQIIYSSPSKKYIGRDLSSIQKKTVLRAWKFIESHPKINLNNFFASVVGYIKCMEDQLGIWGFNSFSGDFNDELINAANFSIVACEVDPDVLL